MRPDTAPSPEGPAPKKKYPAKRAPRYSKIDEQLMTFSAAAAFLSTNLARMKQIIEAEGLRTRRLPGERHAKLFRADVEAVAARAVRVGMPEKTA